MSPQHDDNDNFTLFSQGDDTPQEPQQAPTAPAAPAVPSFGLVFQAADPEVRAPRREKTPSDDTDNGQGNGSDRGERTGDDQEDGGNRRRRGGRGRNKKSDGAGDQGGGSESNSGKGKNSGKSDKDGKDDRNTKNDQSDDSEQKSGKNKGGNDSGKSDDNDDSGEGSSRRRTRRRRRSGSAGDTDDPPGTVTKVREPRKDRDEVQSIKGSTRLEAKKQRRREGREAGRRRTVITEAEFLARRESVERVMVVREREGRTQIGVLEDGVLAEHYVSRTNQQASMAGNVYLGRVQNVLPSMEAAFVDIGRGRNAVLYAGEVNWDAAGLDNQPKRIENALSAGDTVLVQVTKDPIGHKGARLTSQVSLPGRFLVYVPGNSMTGISRKLPDTERSRLKKILKEIVPSDAGVIVRTAAEGASEEDLRADVERLQKTWEEIQKTAKSGNAPSLVHGEPDLTMRVIRDVFNEDFSKLVISGDKSYSDVKDYLGKVAPDLAERVQKWTGEKDVFTEHRIDEQLAKAMDRKVWLPSGGSLIIDRTEAMTVIDVNTGKFVGSGGNLEETVTRNNLEAAEEIVRQMRLRDIGGIIVVDFIDMVLESNRDLVVRRLLECLGRDRTKHQVAEVTSLGLVQMTRKRVGSGLVEIFSEQCMHCDGRGIIVHDHPVEKGGQGGGGNSRRSKKGGTNSKQNDSGQKSKQAEQGNGDAARAAAQIAAAAAAANGKKDDEAQEAAEKVEKVVKEVVADNADDTSGTKAAQDAPKKSGRVRPKGRSAQVDEPTADDSRSEEKDESGAASAEQPAKKRRSRRAATSAATAPAPSQPVEAPAPSAPAPQPEPTAVETGQSEQPDAQQESKPAPKRRRASRRAGSAAGAPAAAQAPEQVVETVVAADAPAGSGAPVADPEPEKAPVKRRPRRARVVAPAGPPTNLEGSDSSE